MDLMWVCRPFGRFRELLCCFKLDRIRYPSLFDWCFPWNALLLCKYFLKSFFQTHWSIITTTTGRFLLQLVNSVECHHSNPGKLPLAVVLVLSIELASILIIQLLMIRLGDLVANTIVLYILRASHNSPTSPNCRYCLCFPCHAWPRHGISVLLGNGHNGTKWVNAT